MYRDDGCEWHVAQCVYAPLNGRQRVMVMHHDKICEEDGFMVHNTLQQKAAARMNVEGSVGKSGRAPPAAGQMYAFIGAHGEYPFTKSPLSYTHVDLECKLDALRSCNLAPEEYADFEEIVQEEANAEEADRAGDSLLTIVRNLLQEDYPKPRSRIGILLPRQPVEKQVLELLLLEALVEEVAASTGQSGAIFELVQQIETEAKADIDEVIRVGKRELMDQWIQEAHAQRAAIARDSQDCRSGGKQQRNTNTNSDLLDFKPGHQTGADRSVVSTLKSTSVEAPALSQAACLQAVDALLTRRRSKSRVVMKVLTRCLHMLSQHTPITAIGKAGSHQTVHFKDFRPLTLVKVHGSKDTTVGRQFVTDIAGRIMQMAVQLGARR